MLMSNQHKGRIEVVKEVFQLAEHRQYARHMYTNFRKMFTGIQFKSLFWVALKASTPEEFRHVKCNARNRRNPNTWSRTFFKIDTSCDAIENGVSEYFKSVIASTRRKPILAMLKEIRLTTITKIFEKLAMK
ncbi:hypothetical protein OSB04_000795 [Centaurea solstitialis]|uniref:Uncharacterized protein n=1 Tax=Centaurea solstitialis TaxID=347529 RepID=A0AA38WU22_9ASTR|nr:hypothetical protein OSB04_000795 [Centaurea solstitialis]